MLLAVDVPEERITALRDRFATTTCRLDATTLFNVSAGVKLTVPPEIEVVVLPRPSDPRDLFDFSGARELIDAAYELANEALDRAAVPRVPVSQRRRFRLRRRGEVAS